MLLLVSKTQPVRYAMSSYEGEASLASPSPKSSHVGSVQTLKNCYNTRDEVRSHGLLFHIIDVVFNIVVIVAIVAGIRTFLVSPFQVEGNSMVDTLEDKQYIIINKLAYILGDPDRGDVVVFRPPSDQEKYYVKRIIGLPGDRISIRGGNVYLTKSGSKEETQLEEDPYLNDRNEGHTYSHPRAAGILRRLPTRFRRVIFPPRRQPPGKSGFTQFRCRQH